MDGIGSYFQNYVSNTLAGTGCQLLTNSGGVQTGIAFYRVFAGGKYGYSFLFSNTADSTFSDGSLSRAGETGKPWKIYGMQAYVTGAPVPDRDVRQARALTFGGAAQKTVRSGEWFATDEAVFDVKETEYLAVKITYEGERLPGHPENLLPCYRQEGGAFVADTMIPVPSMVGCGRRAKKRIAFWGDSITQGIGTERDSYAHYAAVAAKKLGTEYAFWDIGIGYGRAQDAAGGGTWMKKALQSDLLFVCFGVNDILFGRSAEEVKRDLLIVTGTLRAAGKEVVLQTVPPFDWADEKREIWKAVNGDILENPQKYADHVFDDRPFIGAGEDFSRSPYGAHPNAEGCARWGNALCDFIAREKIL